jgi:hypothetical protein
MRGHCRRGRTEDQKAYADMVVTSGVHADEAVGAISGSTEC